jgi:hypothetical protein
MSFINWGQESQKQLEIRRQLEQQALYEQVARITQARNRAGNAPGAAGGGSIPNTNPKAITVSAKHMAIWYEDTVSGAAKFFIANYENLTFSPEIELDPDYTNINDISFRELANGKGWLLRKTDQSSNRTFYFIDGGGNLIETVYTADSPRNDNSFDGFSFALSYTDPETGLVTLKWWGGDTIYTKTFENVDGNTVNYNWFSNDDSTIDGTFSIYYDDDLSEERVYLVNAYTGVVTEITDVITYEGEKGFSDGMHGSGNFMYVTFQSQNDTTSTASYTNGTNAVTLSAPNTNIRIGDAILGDSIDPNTYVLEINGTAITLSQNVVGDETDVTVTFNGLHMDLLRIIKTDGTYTDIDISVYNAWDINETFLVGTNKLIIWLRSYANGLNDTLISIDPVTTGCWFLTFDNNGKYGNSFLIQTDRLRSFEDWAASPAGAESFSMYLYDNGSSDGTMTRYSPLLIVWTNTTTGEIYSYEPTTGSPLTAVPTGPYPAGVYIPDQSYTDVPVVNPVGFDGISITWNITTNSNGDFGDIGVANTGSGYKVGDQIVILGSSIGGSSPADDVTFDIAEISTFGLVSSNQGNTAPIVLYANAPNETKVQILQLNQDGTIALTDTVTDYEDAGSYFDNIPLGDDYVLLTHYDNSQAPNIQFWGIWDVQQQGFVGDDWFWTTTSNSWGTNYDTFWMSDNTEFVTYWWNSSQGQLGNIPTTVGTGSIGNGTYKADENNGGEYVDYHQTGTTLLVLSPDQGYLLSSNNTPPALLDLNGDISVIRLNKTHFYNLWPDSENSDKYVIDAYNLEGDKTQTITTDLDNYYDFYVVGDRVYLTQEDGGDLIIYAISPTTYVTKTISKESWSNQPNDWLWWND